MVSSDVGAAVWLGSGGQMMRPCSSNFMPSARPILVSISLISLSDLRPKFFVFSISFSLFCTSSRMVNIRVLQAVVRAHGKLQLLDRTVQMLESRIVGDFLRKLGEIGRAHV